MKSLSDDEVTKTPEEDGWHLLSADNLESYHTKEFENAQFFADKEDFDQLNISSADDSFEPIFPSHSSEDSGKDFQSVESNFDHKKTSNDKISGKGAGLGVLESVVEQEKEASYNEGFEAGKAQGEKEAYDKLLKENESLREDEKARGFEEGKADGLEAGKEEAYENLREEFREKGESLVTLLESLSDSWRSVIEKYESEIIELSLNIAKKVLYSNLTLEPDFVKVSIKEAMIDIPEPVDVTISVNPDDYNIIEMIKEDFFQKFEDLQNITILSDPSIGRGGCSLKSETGGTTQTIENRLKIMEQALLKDGLKKNKDSGL